MAAEYRKMIADIIDKIKSEKLLKRIYNLCEFLYLNHDNSEDILKLGRCAKFPADNKLNG